MAASKKNRAGSETQFPGKLHDMMKFVEQSALESIISWELNGYGIKINNPDRLVEILPVFFGQTKYRSFRRQLNMWHFHRILEGPNKGVFVHPYFVKHNRDMCSKMSRQITFKPTPEKEQEYIALASCIEPDPIREPSRALDMRIPHSNLTEISNTRNDIHDDFFQVSDFRLPVLSQSNNVLPPLPPLPGQETKASLGEALKTVEDVLLNLPQNNAFGIDDSVLEMNAAWEPDPIMADFDDELGSIEEIDSSLWMPMPHDYTNSVSYGHGDEQRLL